MEYGVYVHVPFCRSRCHYCDFYSTLLPDGQVPEAYVDALLRVFARYAPQGGALPITVYFGGGTPGLLAPAQVARLLAALRPAPGAEVTLEANPESLTEESLAGFRAAGVNRLSIGVQSARDDSLGCLGRPHTAAAARRALAQARAAGFTNLSGDVMLALPGYTDAELDETLQLLDEGGATHISAYMLKIERGTPFGTCPPAGLPDEDTAAAHYLYAAVALEKAGYARYEISNFARPGCESRHNLLYWAGGSWLGLGPAAHSCMAGRRFSFAPSLKAFLQGAAPKEEGAFTYEDDVMLRLRLQAGLDEEALRLRWGRGLGPRQRALLAQLATAGLARKTAAGCWALTGEGMLVQNAILARLL